MIFGRQSFTFADVESAEFGLWISGQGTYDASERDVTVVEVPGKNGSLVYDNGRYKNVEVTYPAFLTRDFPMNAELIRNWLLTHSNKYYRLSDTYHPDEFRLARYSGNVSYDVKALHREGEIEIRFDCKPQRFLLDGDEEQAYTVPGVIMNPTPFPSKPLIRVYGAGTLSVGDGVITVTAAPEPGYTDIDCDSMEAYCGATNCNSNISLADYDFPELSPGRNGIGWTTGITKVCITPRWWIL